MNIAVVGLGLIGGSFCKAIKTYTNHKVFGLDINPEVVFQAFEAKAIDKEITPQNLRQIDIVFCCLYPGQTIDFLKKHKNLFKKNCIICDTCGVKQSVVKKAEHILPNEVYFVSLHPMAGREYSGFAYSKADLFQGASLVICPGEKPNSESIQMIEALTAKLGFEEPIFAAPKHHDEMIAFTSQLAHVVSNAYIKSSAAMKVKGFMGGSFQDLTRVAMLNAPMWTELFLLNQKPLLAELEQLISHLNEYVSAIKNNDANKLCELLQQGSNLKEKSLSSYNKIDK